MRRTDLYTALPLSQHTTNEAFERFADTALGGSGGAARLYVATDNADTQERFVSRYGEAILMRPAAGVPAVLLYGLPAGLLVIGGIVAFTVMRRGRNT